MAVQYRHEMKFMINYADLLSVRSAMKAVASPDPHTGNGSYHIRSLYFDTPEDKALREKIDGVNMREKFRIRFYDLDTSVIHLEKKSRRNGLGTKFSADLTAEEARKIVDGDLDWMPGSGRELVKELYCSMRSRNLRPKTIVDYTREPFIYGPGNVRVTLDYDIRTGLSCTDFLNPDAITIPAGDAPILMEIKWDNYLPSIIRDAAAVSNRRAGAFSKYAQCRIYG